MLLRKITSKIKKEPNCCSVLQKLSKCAVEYVLPRNEPYTTISKMPLKQKLWQKNTFYTNEVGKANKKRTELLLGFAKVQQVCS